MRIRNGQILTGSVVQIVDGEVCVNIGYKSDGFIPRNEFSSDADVNPADVVKIGDPIEVEVIKVNDGEGNVLLSHKNVESKKMWDTLTQDEHISEKVFDAVGKEVVKGGLIATIEGVRAFVPASQLSTKYVEKIEDMVGKPITLKVIEVDKSRKRIVASHKAVMMEEAEKARKQRWAELEVGSKVKGVVRRLVPVLQRRQGQARRGEGGDLPQTVGLAADLEPQLPRQAHRQVLQLGRPQALVPGVVLPVDVGAVAAKVGGKGLDQGGICPLVGIQGLFHMDDQGVAALFRQAHGHQPTLRQQAAAQQRPAKKDKKADKAEEKTVEAPTEKTEDSESK